MIVANEKNVIGKKIEAPGINNVVKKILISPTEGWAGYVMRQFELGEGGCTPRHSHPWPHIGYILAGKGVLHLDGVDYEVEPGSFAYVPGEKIHQFACSGSEIFKFICIVPQEGDV